MDGGDGSGCLKPMLAITLALVGGLLVGVLLLLGGLEAINFLLPPVDNPA